MTKLQDGKLKTDKSAAKAAGKHKVDDMQTVSGSKATGAKGKEKDLTKQLILTGADIMEKECSKAEGLKLLCIVGQHLLHPRLVRDHFGTSENEDPDENRVCPHAPRRRSKNVHSKTDFSACALLGL